MSIIETLETILFGQRRSIAGIIPDVVIEEKHDDELVITDHPVEYGSPISDHAYKQPPAVVMKFGWSDNSILVNSVLSGSIFSGVMSLKEAYNKILDLQDSLVPFDLITGKREYSNMLIKSVAMTTDVATENALILTVTFRQVFLTYTEEAELRAADQADPSKTASPQSGGTRQPEPVDESILSSTTGAGQVGGAL